MSRLALRIENAPHTVDAIFTLLGGRHCSCISWKSICPGELSSTIGGTSLPIEYRDARRESGVLLRLEAKVHIRFRVVM